MSKSCLCGFRKTRPALGEPDFYDPASKCLNHAGMQGSSVPRETESIGLRQRSARWNSDKCPADAAAAAAVWAETEMCSECSGCDEKRSAPLVR